MNNIYEQFGTNKDSETNGVWVETGDEKTSPAFKLARMSSTNKKYSKALEAATRKHKAALRVGALPTEKAVKIEKEVFVSTILLDWRNISDKNGKELKFDKSNALKVMHDLPDLYEFLREQATETAIFKDVVTEDDAKN